MDNSTKRNPILISLITNFLLMIGKAVVGLLTNSNALVADAAHSMTDVIFFFINYRACKECKIYEDIDKKKKNKSNKEKILQAEAHASYLTGVILLTIGLSICFHNFMILVLDKAEKPDAISVIAAFITLAVYAGLYKYLEGEEKNGACILTTENTFWQNKINLISGLVVIIGLISTLFGFIFMDEFAAIVVGSIILSMGTKLVIQAMNHLSVATSKNFKYVAMGIVTISIIVSWITLSIQIK